MFFAGSEDNLMANITKKKLSYYDENYIYSYSVKVNNTCEENGLFSVWCKGQYLSTA